MRYDDISKCNNGVPAIPTAIVSEIEKLSEIKGLSFILAVGAGEDGEGDRLVALVPEDKIDGVIDVKFPIDTTQLLDATCITMVKYKRNHYFVNPPGKCFWW